MAPPQNATSSNRSFFRDSEEPKELSGPFDARLPMIHAIRIRWPQAMSKPCSDGASNGCPTWIRTMTRRVKVACAAITPSGSDEWNGHAAALFSPVKAGNTRRRPRFLPPPPAVDTLRFIPQHPFAMPGICEFSPATNSGFGIQRCVAGSEPIMVSPAGFHRERQITPLYPDTADFEPV